jgi:hypothetical protein
MLPSTFEIVELRLSVALAGETPRNALNKSRNPFTPFSELWTGQIVFAAVGRNAAMEQIAALEAFDGKVGSFGVTLKQGFATHANSFSGSLAVAAVAGADTITVQTGTATDLKAGTLLQIGASDSASYQLVEVLQDVSVPTAGAVIYIAPRIRYAIAGSTAVTGGDVTAVLRLAKDEFAPSYSIDNGAIAIDVIEAI